MKVLIIIPAHNEARSLPSLIPEIQNAGWDYLVVNDGSTDETETVLQTHHFNHLDLANNIGLAGVTQMGFLYARDHSYDAAVVVDGDGQHLPRYIPDLVNQLNDGYDYVIGSRFKDQKKPWNMRMIGSRLLALNIKIKTGVWITDPTSGMRALGKTVIADFAEHMNFVAEPDAFVHIARSGYRYCEVPVKMQERESGSSYFGNPLKSLRFMFDVIMSILFIQW